MTSRTTRRAFVTSAKSAALLFGITTIACSDPGRPAATTEAPSGSAPCAVNRNDEVRQLLAPACEGCHAAKSNRPFFASLDAFEDQLVYDTKFVKSGNPEESYLVALLEGTASGNYKQMPIAGRSFAERSKHGETKITIEQVKDWIRKLPPPRARSTSADVDAPTTRRLTAEELTASLRRLLGLAESPVLAPTTDVRLRIGSPDAPVNGLPWGVDWDDATRRFEALGGGNSFAYRLREKEFTPATLQTLVQVSQDWCAIAVALPGNKALFKYATSSSKSDADAEAIKKNIGYLHLRFLGEPATAAAIDAVYTRLFLKYEPKGPGVAWTAVCANFVRHPQALTL